VIFGSAGALPRGGCFAVRRADVFLDLGTKNTISAKCVVGLLCGVARAGVFLGNARPATCLGVYPPKCLLLSFANPHFFFLFFVGNSAAPSSSRRGSMLRSTHVRFGRRSWGGMCLARWRGRGEK
jgi:hypothetical protein